MLRDSVPKISCLLATCGRVKHVIEAIRCYLAQTYPNTELVVVSQGGSAENCEINRFIEASHRRDIRFYVAPRRHSLGAMRNLSCELASGEILCQWDDDDLYSHTRISDQYKSLSSHSKHSASAFSKFLKYFKNSGEMYWCDWIGEGVDSSRFLCGSVMFPKKIFHRYRSLLYPESGDQCHVEEDLNVLCKLLDCGVVANTGGGHQYVYVYHGDNTYPLKHHQLTLLTNSGKHVATADELLMAQPLLCHTLAELPLEAPVEVRSLDEVAFTFGTQSPMVK